MLRFIYATSVNGTHVYMQLCLMQLAYIQNTYDSINPLNVDL